MPIPTASAYYFPALGWQVSGRCRSADQVCTFIGRDNWWAQWPTWHPVQRSYKLNSGKRLPPGQQAHQWAIYREANVLGPRCHRVATVETCWKGVVSFRGADTLQIHTIPIATNQYHPLSPERCRNLLTLSTSSNIFQRKLTKSLQSTGASLTGGKVFATAAGASGMTCWHPSLRII